MVRQQSASSYNLPTFSAPSTPIVPSLGSLSSFTGPPVVSNTPMKPRLFMAVSDDDRHYIWEPMGVYDANDLDDVSYNV
jgi:hypothetical protein